MANLGALVGALRNMIEADLKSSIYADDDWTKFCNLYDLTGHLETGIENKLVISVSSIQIDGSVNNYTEPFAVGGSGYAVSHPKIFMDVYVTIASTFSGDGYRIGLEMLSRVVGFFQEHPTIGAAQSPEIGAEMGRLAIEFISLDFVQAGNLSTLTGVKGLPFLLVRLRRVPFESGAISGVATPVRAAGSRSPPSRGA